jgi:hypothetical protein
MITCKQIYVVEFWYLAHKITQNKDYLVIDTTFVFILMQIKLAYELFL